MYVIQNPADGSYECVQDTTQYVGWPVIATVDALPEFHEIVDGEVVPVLADYQTQKRAEVDVYLAAQFGAGYTPTTGSLAGQTLQTRNDTDRTNWLTSQAAYSAQVSAGQGSVADAEFRTASNETITLTYAEGLQVLLDMAAWGKGLMQKSWLLKDQIDALTDAPAVQAFDVEAEWAAL